MSEIKPQPGPQDDFLSTAADIAIYGGAAGGGKTFSLLMEPLRHVANGDFGAVIFRRTTKQIREQGGLWQESEELYNNIDGAYPVETHLKWTFPSGMKVTMAHMEHEKNKLDWQGTQIPLLGFDELTHFSYTQFFYMLSRNRSMSGVPGYVRATCNPDPDSWVADFIAWWIDDDGFAIPQRSGLLRWFIRLGDEIIWADTKKELEEEFGTEEEPVFPKSVTFIPSKLSDNKILMKKDPSYLANLKALPRVEQARLLGGNWKVRAQSGDMFQTSSFPVIDAIDLPHQRRKIRFWDRAGTEKNEKNEPDWTVGLLLSQDNKGNFYIEDVERRRKKPAGVIDMIKNTASFDDKKVTVGIEQDPGQAGVFEKDYYIKELVGYHVYVSKPVTDKVTRAKPVSSQAQHGNVYVVRGNWNKSFFDEAEAFPFGKKDQIDALSGAFNYFVSGPQIGEQPKAKKSKTMATSHKRGSREW